MVAALELPAEYADKMREQILSQIMQHIKTHTKQKPAEEREAVDDSMYRNYQPIRFNNEYPEEDMEKEENEKKKMSRMRRNDMKRTMVINTSQPNRYFKEKKVAFPPRRCARTARTRTSLRGTSASTARCPSNCWNCSTSRTGG